MQTVKCIIFQQHLCERSDERNENLLFHIVSQFIVLNMGGFKVSADIWKEWDMNFQNHLLLRVFKNNQIRKCEVNNKKKNESIWRNLQILSFCSGDENWTRDLRVMNPTL